MPKISVIIPIYNVEKHLRRCLDSVKNQTFEDWQAICVDDGTPDDSGKIAESYAAQDKRFIVVHKENGGVADARNAGMKHVTGEYVMYLDSDDFIHPQTMEIAYGLAKKDDIDLVSLGITKISQDMHIDKFDNITDVDFIVTDNVLKYAAERDGIKSKFAIKRSYVVSKLYKTELIRNIKFPQHVKLCEDFYWISLVYSKLPRTLIARVPVYYYVQNDGSLLHSINKPLFVQSMCIGLKHGFDVCKNIKKKYFMLYNKNFIWPFVYSVVRTIKSIDNIDDRKQAIECLKDIYDYGVCSKPIDLQSLKYYIKIRRLISSIR